MSVIEMVLALAVVAVLALVVWKVAASRRAEPKSPPPPRYVCDQCNDTDCVCTKQDEAH